MYHGAFDSLAGNWQGRAGQVFLNSAKGTSHSLATTQMLSPPRPFSFYPFCLVPSLQAAPFSCLAELKEIGFSFPVPPGHCKLQICSGALSGELCSAPCRSHQIPEPRLTRPCKNTVQQTLTQHASLQDKREARYTVSRMEGYPLLFLTPP